MRPRQPSQVSGSDPVATGVRGGVQSWLRFWFTPTDPLSLTVVRVLTGLLIVGWLLPFAADPEAFFGLQGWFDRKAYAQAARLPEGPPVPITWSIFYLAGDNGAAVTALYWASLAVVLLFTLGVLTRPTSVLTWVVVASGVANPATSYDGDVLLVLLTFYLALAYLLLGQWSERLAWWERILGSRQTLLGVFQRLRRSPASNVAATDTTRIAANLGLRLIQVHFALVIFISGVHKLQFGEWWSGTALWYPMHQPFDTTAESIRSEAPSASTTLVYLSLAQYALLAWQIAFPVMAWRRSCRWLVLGGALVGWIGCVTALGLPLFGPSILIACLSFVSSDEWRRWGSWFARFRGTGAHGGAAKSDLRGQRVETPLVR